MEMTYTPSLVPETITDRWSRRPVHWRDRRCREAGAYHPHMLAAPAYWPSHRLRRVAREEGILFCDSGGFQVVSQGVVRDPLQVLRWQILQADRGPILDFPPDEGKAAAPKDPQRRFRYALHRTVLNVRAALPTYQRLRRRGTPFRWMGVVHGSTRAELKCWYERVAEIHPFDSDGEGWAFRPVPAGSPEGVARILAFCRDRGIKRIHLFVPGGPPAVATLLALGPEAGISEVTFDSSSPITAANNRSLYLPDEDGLGWTCIQERGLERHIRNFMLQECPCVSCRWMAEDVLRAPGRIDEGYVKHRRRFHNVLTHLGVYRALEREARREPRRLLRRKLGRRLRPTLEAFHSTEAS